MRRPRILVALGLWLVCVCVPAGCRPAAPRPITTLTIATGGTGGVYYPLGDALARLYTRSIPDVRATALATVASVFNVQAVQQGKADLAFTQGDVAYLAYAGGTAEIPRPLTNLRGMAVLYVNSVQIVARADSDIRSVRDLRGKRVGVGAPASGTEAAARIIIEAYGLRYSDVKADFLSFADTADQLENRTLDAGFLVSSYPVAALTEATTKVGIRLLPVETEVFRRMRETYPFFKPVTIPKQTYRGLEADLPTVGVDNLLVCRADLPDDLVYQLTRVFFESLPALARTHVAAQAVDPDEGPTTPIPLHPGAARYYRELELLR
jgi:TRAP transporter TAXI family solute receptor